MTCVEVNARVSVVVVAGIVSFKRPAQLVMFVKLMTVEEENDCASRGPVAVRETLSVSSERKVRPSVSKEGYMHLNSGTTNMGVRDRKLCEYGG